MNDIWSKIKRGAENECWEWIGSCYQRSGYGRVNTSRNNGTTAHRVVWIELHGNPGMLEVCHTCDNRKCCNPKHLFLGTDKDNAADTVAKNRQARFPGVINQSAKLTEQQVIEIRSSVLSHAELARRFHVSESNIRFIRKRGTWSHLP